MSTLLEEIKAQIVSLKTDVAQSNIGTVREISDGVAKIEGLSDAALNEMLDFPDGITGIALTKLDVLDGFEETRDASDELSAPAHYRVCALNVSHPAIVPPS